MSELFIPSKGIKFWSVLYRSDLVSEAEILPLLTQKNYLIRKESFLPQANYYAKEMGGEEKLKKFFLVELETSDRESLVSEKLKAVELENTHSREQSRMINIDPGMITLENVLLTSGKNYGHRVYILDGVFYELELIYTKNKFEKLPWTYPDYQTLEVLEFFKSMRAHLQQLLA